MPNPTDKSSRTPTPPRAPWSEREIDELQSLLDRVPAPLEPLDVSMLDGFLCGVLVQPHKVPAERWLAHVTDADGRAPPRGFDASRLQALVLRRHADLNAAIVQRQWFDPWVFELEDAASAAPPAPDRLDDDDDDDDDDGEGDDSPTTVDAVYPWVAGFATALELFPQLIEQDSPALTEPLALLYRHLDPEDLEDADELLAEIDSLEPPAELSEAVEGLVRATLLLADVGRPLQASIAPRPGAPRRPPPRRH
ncbi:MAG: hypothetical protein AD742_12915 [Methylibium sp. NZG]|nr:MAG: hypothetical protein AD742_12915 [Methylibium sp. NZG]